MAEELELQLVQTLIELLRDRSVTRVAGRLGVTQSAVSQRLRRLREALGDELLVATPQGMVPTDRAKRMVSGLELGMATVRRALAEGQSFDPASAQREFAVATSDYGQLIALPRLLSHLGQHAPGISVRIVPSSKDLSSALAKGDIDLVIGGNLPTSPDLMRRRIGEEGFVVMMRQGHPASRRRFDLDAYLSYDHVLIAPRGAPGGTVDMALQALGKRRSVVLTVPHFVVAPLVLANTDLLLTGPRGLPAALRPHLTLVTRKPPLALADTPLDVLWHARSQSDPAHRWFRGLIVGEGKQVASS